MYAETKKSDTSEVKILKEPTTLQVHSINKKAAILNKSSQINDSTTVHFPEYSVLQNIYCSEYLDPYYLSLSLIFVIYEHEFRKVLIFFVCIKVIVVIALLCTGQLYSFFALFRKV